jgi:hypothetical protein
MSDDELTLHLKCDVELELNGPNERTLNQWAATALRAVAARMENGEYEDGFEDVKDSTGKKVGTIYVDYSESDA